LLSVYIFHILSAYCYLILCRWGRGTGKTHGGFWSGPDRWSPGVLIDHKWENAMTVDKESWGNRKTILIEDILEMKVSKTSINFHH
jgi:hypothetical protein